MTPTYRRQPPSRPQSATGQQLAPATDRNFTIAKRSRGRTGCLNCRRRRKKCDESKPLCSKCASRGETCEWDTGYTFRLSGIDAQHPSMAQSRLSQTEHAKTYEIMQVSFAKDSHLEPTDPGECTAPAQDLSSASDEESLWESNEPQITPNVTSVYSGEPPNLGHGSAAENMVSEQQHPSRANNFHRRSTASSDARGTDPPSCGRSSNDMGQVIPKEFDISGRNSSTLDTLVTTGALIEPNVESCIIPEFRHSETLNYHQPSLFQPNITSIELGSLDFLTSQSSNTSVFPTTTQPQGTSTWNSVDDPNLWSSPVANNSIDAETPDSNMSYPNAAYKSLHTTLYHHMVETARNTALTRHGTPDQSAEDSTAASNEAHRPFVFERPISLRDSSLSTNPLKSTKIPKRRQLELWRNYLDEIAVWLDMFDSKRHFQLQIPQLAKSADHLHYSVLALSARQIERKDPEKPYTESLGLYQEAIRLILQELHTLDTAVIASCVLLCVLEMMSSAPRAWSRHLDGCAMLLEAAGVNGVVGGVRQSLFWCFARMDVWGGFLGDTLTKIPTSRWFVPSKSMVDAINHFKEGSGCDSYANYAVFLCASVVNVISNKSDLSVAQHGASSASVPTFSDRWKALFDLLEDWYNRRPQDMQPIVSFPSVSEEYQHPFPSVLYNNSPAINGSQLYHAATILMLQEKPKDVSLPKTVKSILWHARQICGIAASNYSHGPWINALQPLWIAGKIMSHSTEHKAILQILECIEHETGWATAWRAQDLKEYWGDPNG